MTTPPENGTPIDRSLVALFAVAVAILYIGGALLFAKVFTTAQDNVDFICSFGTALNAAPVKQRADIVRLISRRDDDRQFDISRRCSGV